MRLTFILFFLFICHQSITSKKCHDDSIAREIAIRYIRASQSYKSYTASVPNDTLRIGNRYCNDKLKTCLYDFIGKRYQKDYETIISDEYYSRFKAIKDSLKANYQFYYDTSDLGFNEDIPKLNSQTDTGYIASFSTFRDNHLSVEIINYKYSYYSKRRVTQGQSLTYYFVYDGNCNISEVYEGAVYYD